MMDGVIEVLVVLAEVWRLFESVEVPGFGIKFSTLWIGFFVVNLSISILHFLMSIENIYSFGNRVSNRIKYFSNRKRKVPKQ